MKTRAITVALGIVATFAAGCSGGDDAAQSLVGEWASIEPIDQSHNEMSLEEAGVGSATVFIFRTVNNKPAATAFSFDLAWEDLDEAIEVEMHCVESPFGECEAEDDILMDCDVSPEMVMSCQAEGRWRDYDFAWQKR